MNKKGVIFDFLHFSRLWEQVSNMHPFNSINPIMSTFLQFLLPCEVARLGSTYPQLNNLFCNPNVNVDYFSIQNCANLVVAIGTIDKDIKMRPWHVNFPFDHSICTNGATYLGLYPVTSNVLLELTGRGKQ